MLQEPCRVRAATPTTTPSTGLMARLWRWRAQRERVDKRPDYWALQGELTPLHDDTQAWSHSSGLSRMGEPFSFSVLVSLENFFSSCSKGAEMEKKNREKLSILPFKGVKLLQFFDKWMVLKYS